MAKLSNGGVLVCRIENINMLTTASGTSLDNVRKKTLFGLNPCTLNSSSAPVASLRSM